ncbi:MAG TPA: MBL fold metallo-hydrolase [Actinomycetota bacterium]|jgi:glyoxylase-like metal-dependent hydrolase (beta-lactamase superfamily II)/8-oxo-dGTP pyrophosphatase MutT (NUDIX family)|nr:MBL fold metallo-hydrolase [Actinomycetota bacterium]
MPTPRDAATVILARPTADNAYEVLLTRRPESMVFMGGTFVFPGGAVEEADCADGMAACSAMSREEALERLNESIAPERALGLFCCGARELYEEAGILLATERTGRAVDPAKVREVYAPHHAEVGHDPATFAAFLSNEGLTLQTEALVPHGRLVTPEQSPIRFDARFFVAPMPEGQAVIPHPTEVLEWLWISPLDALERAHRKELAVPIPTLAILQGLAEIPGYEQVLGGRTKPREVEATELSPLVTVVLAPNPGLMTGAGTNTYVVGRDEVVIIDPGIPDPVFVERVAREAGNRGTPKLILLTHTHIDHIGGVAPLAEQMKIPVAAFANGEDAAPFVTLRLTDGEEIGLGGASLRALHTPGHASNHLCYYLETERAVFAGDLVAGFGTVVIAPPDGNMRSYLDSLTRLLELDLGRIYPGHGPVVEDGPAKLEEYIAHRKDRERQVVEAMSAGLTELPDMVKRIYAEVPEALHPMAERSLLAHLEMLEADGRAVRDEDHWRLVAEP